jgi:GT2 family glycosyltransferase
MATAGFPRVSYVRNPENRGFAAAANEGFRRSSGEFVLFLNSDTRLIEGETSKILDLVRQERSIGIAAPQLVYGDMRLQRSFAPIPCLAFELLPRAVLALFSPRFRTKGKGLTAPSDVESLIGAALLVRREVLDAVGGFDEGFFFFLEETDLCLRAGRKGFRVVFVPAARLIHLQGKTVSRSWVRGRIEYSISLYAFIRKYHGRPYWAAFVFVRLCKALLFLAPATLLPFVLFSQSVRRKYRYYGRLLAWHIQGRPAEAGLRPGIRERAPVTEKTADVRRS